LHAANVANLQPCAYPEPKREVACAARWVPPWPAGSAVIDESTILALLAEALDWFWLNWGAVLISLAARFTNRTDEIGIDASVLVFTSWYPSSQDWRLGLMPALSFRKDSEQTRPHA